MKSVSVVVATYRRSETLKKALFSLSEQSCADMEIVLVDDNADAQWNEAVSAIVDSFCNQFPTVSVNYIVNQLNQGSAKTRNLGIKAASGEYITFLDDDDIYLPDKVKNQVEFMERGGYDYSITDLMLYNEEDKEIDRRVRTYIKDTAPESLKIYHLKYHMTGTDTMMFRKDYLTKIGGFAPIDVGDEFYLMQRAIEGGGKFGYLPGCEIKAYVHTGEGGLSSGQVKIDGENVLYEHKKKYFDQLSCSDRRYINMRHYAVVAYAYLRMKRFVGFFVNSGIAFMISPVDCVKLLLGSQKDG